MAEKTIYNDPKIELINCHKQPIDILDNLTITPNNTILIYNLCNEMAKKIKDQAVDFIGHVAINTSSKV